MGRGFEAPLGRAGRVPPSERVWFEWLARERAQRAGALLRQGDPSPGSGAYTSTAAGIIPLNLRPGSGAEEDSENQWEPAHRSKAEVTAGERSFLVVGAMSSLYDRAGITVHEQTPHRIAPPDSLRAAPSVRSIARTSVPMGVLFVLRHVLSPSECAHFIAAAEALGMRDTGVEHKVRRADRVVAFGEDVAALLYARCAREHFAPLPPPPAAERQGARARWRRAAAAVAARRSQSVLPRVPLRRGRSLHAAP